MTRRSLNVWIGSTVHRSKDHELFESSNANDSDLYEQFCSESTQIGLLIRKGLVGCNLMVDDGFVPCPSREEIVEFVARYACFCFGKLVGRFVCLVVSHTFPERLTRERTYMPRTQ